MTMLLTAFVALLFTSCNKPVTNDTHTLGDEKWMRFKPEKFQFNVKDYDDCYDILLTLRIDTTIYTENELPLIVDLYTPNDEHRMFNVSLLVHNKKGKLNGTRMGQYVDVTVPAKQWFFFNTDGKYRLEVKQATSHYEISGITNIQVLVKKSDMRLKESN